MKSFSTILFVFLFGHFFSSCNEKSGPRVNTPSYNQAYGYFPSEDAYQWNYLKTVKTGQDSIGTQTDVTGVYSKPSKSIIFTSNNLHIGSANWYNTGSRLLCCNGSILIDYTKLSCNKDSVVTREETQSGTFIRTFQYCNTQQIGVEGYEHTECIKTTQTNIFTDGSELYIERYFGFGVGLIFERQITTGVNGEVSDLETLSLVSHEFQ